MTRDRDPFLAILMVALAVVALIAWIIYQRSERDECRARGGTVVEIRGDADARWFCQERQP